MTRRDAWTPRGHETLPRKGYEVVLKAAALLDVTDMERRIIVFLASLQTRDHWYAWTTREGRPINETLAVELGVSDIMVKRAIAGLIKREWLARRNNELGRAYIQLRLELLAACQEALDLQQIRRHLGSGWWLSLRSKGEADQAVTEIRETALETLTDARWSRHLTQVCRAWMRRWREEHA